MIPQMVIAAERLSASWFSTWIRIRGDVDCPYVPHKVAFTLEHG
jgi:hypothetical protein